MASHRNSERISIRAQDHPALQFCVSDRTMRVMVFCAAGNTGTQEVAFPYQCELKVNGGDIKANLRGLKNKPGSTRPVDITDSLRLRPAGYANTIEITYALTQKVGAASQSAKSPAEVCLARADEKQSLTGGQKFYLSLIVCKTVPIETLVVQIYKKIRRDSVITESKSWLGRVLPRPVLMGHQLRKRPVIPTWLPRRRT